MAEPPLQPQQGPGAPDHGSLPLDTQKDHLEVAELLTSPLFPNASTPTSGVGNSFPREFPTLETATMTDHPQEPQKPQTAVARAQEDPLDESFVFGSPLFPTFPSPNAEDIGAMLEAIDANKKRKATNDDDDDDVGSVGEEEGTPDDNPRPSRPKKQKRNKVSYSKRQLVANHMLFLNSHYEPQWKQEYGNREIRLIGTITHCANKKNEQHYTIAWDTTKLGIDKKWLITKFKKSKELQGVLQRAMREHDEDPLLGGFDRATAAAPVEETPVAPLRRSPRRSSAPSPPPTPPMPPLVRRSPRRLSQQSRNNTTASVPPGSPGVTAAMGLAALRNASTHTAAIDSDSSMGRR